MKTCLNMVICILLISIAMGQEHVKHRLSIGTALSDHMVVQQNSDLSLWGNAIPGTKVDVSASWKNGRLSAKSDPDGRWAVSIPVPTAVPGDSRPHSIRIFSSGESIHLSDVRIGDVWLCSGQSNMDMTVKPFLPWLKGALHYREVIESGSNPAIRLFDVRTDFDGKPRVECRGRWVVATPTTVGDFSAVAYFFARNIQRVTGIPVGMVVSSVGASSGQAWTSRKALSEDGELMKRYLMPYDTSAKSKEALDSIVTFEKVLRPTLLYNTMIHPLGMMRLRGVLWYQGESNRRDGPEYARLMSAMIQDWRLLFRDDRLPFYYVQVAPFRWADANDDNHYAEFREVQSMIRGMVGNTEMALTMDIAEADDLHPTNKQDLAFRLSKLALARTYGMDSVVCTGPDYLGMSVQDSLAKVRFTKSSTGSGLATSDGLAPRHFQLAGEDRVFHPAVAMIKGDEVHLSTPLVPKPRHIRYAFKNDCVTNFGNREGFPAIPFRTDR